MRKDGKHFLSGRTGLPSVPRKSIWVGVDIRNIRDQDLRRAGGRKPGLLAERSLLGPVHGAYGDYVLLSEDLLPSDIEEQINRRSVPFENLEGGSSVS